MTNFNLCNYDNITFEGKLSGMNTIFMKIGNPGYIPSKYYQRKWDLGVPARTMDSLYEAIRLYKSGSSGKTSPVKIGDKSYGSYVAATNKGYIAELQEDSMTTCIILGKKRDGSLYIKGMNINNNDISSSLTLSQDTKKIIFLALMPIILQETEAHQIYDTMSDFLEWDPEADDWLFNDHITEFSELLNRFSCNIEARINTGIPEAIKIDLSKVSPLKQNELQLDIIKEYCGRPVRFINQAISKPQLSPTMNNSVSPSFEGSYRYDDNRIFTAEEKNLIAKVSPRYIMPDWVPEICEYFKESSSFPSPMRVAYLIGPAGTGKTEAANTIAAGLGLPIDHYTCNPSTEIFDFIGQVFPNTNDEKVDFETVRVEMGLPSTDDVINDPVGCYKKVYGKDAIGFPNEGSIIVDMINRVMEEVAKRSGNGKNFTYVESGLIKAARLGYCFEIQEIGCVLRPGVAVGLNALLETGKNSFITLPTGEVIKKHPDCTFIFTSNDEYEGCCNLNQSVLDRMSLVYRIENPPAKVMQERIISRLGFPDEKILERMVSVITELSSAAKNKGIDDGVCGYRALENWAMALMIKAKFNGGIITDALAYQTAINTVMNKVSQKSDYVEELMSILTYQFASPNLV